MKLTLSIATVLFYTIFSFLFAALCPAICLGIGPEVICEVVCDAKPQTESKCCSESCAMVCEETEPLAICIGAYGTQNSIRTDCFCPAPAKTPATFESYRLFKDTDQLALTLISHEYSRPDISRDITLDARPCTIHSAIIATTVLRI